MNIEAGKRYWTRAGGLTAPLRARALDDILYAFTDGTTSWTKSGTFYVDEKTRDPWDLVAEYTGPELIPPLIPEVGKRYVDEKEGVTPPVKAIHDSKVWFDGSYRGAYRWFSELKREYQGKDDPINAAHDGRRGETP